MNKKNWAGLALVAGFALFVSSANVASADTAVGVDAKVNADARVMMRREGPNGGPMGPREGTTTRAYDRGEGFGEKIGKAEDRIHDAGAMGSITAMNGTSLTILGKQAFSGTSTASTTFSVDASNAKVRVNNASSTLSSLSVGDKIVVRGTVTGSSIVAAEIVRGDLDMKRLDEVKGRIEDRMGNRLDNIREKMASSTQTHPVALMKKIGDFFRGFFHGKAEVKAGAHN